ncbi:3-hydroxybutyryl-CoA dehydrogenase [Sphingobacteriales bacterium UPWRP_1]|nr:3-hydroxybutyryl-CoA dehydrogenase [Sphingobacteriales bacterium TSM_CSS]PSJ76726.1 3-hydroxybutyryl-CoA dehydrogenase [Sphingobacteriales bacterium UPWRP_1]
MHLPDIKKIAVIGAGVMGGGIAQVCAAAGFKTVLFDVEPDALPRAMQQIEKNLDTAVKRNKLSTTARQQIIKRIDATSFFGELKADFIIEAIVEDLNIKLEVLKQVAEQNPPQVILASNTSSIPITRIAARLPHPQRVVGMHFFNPAHLMQLVEVISGQETTAQVAHTTFQLAQKLGKTPVMAKDSPGFIVNRVARHFYVEALKILEENVADVAAIDDLAEASGFKMGPFRLMDLIGVDTNFAVTRSMYESFHHEPRFRPSRIQQQKVEAGHWGRKKGIGFYHYPNDKA